MSEQTRTKKLAKAIEGNIVKITEAVTGAELSFDFGTLPADIQTKLGPFGLGHKLGDAAAGKAGQEAVDAIKKVWDGLASGDWSVKAPKGPSVTIAAIWKTVSAMPVKERDKAIATLQAAGIDLSAFLAPQA